MRLIDFIYFYFFTFLLLKAFVGAWYGCVVWARCPYLLFSCKVTALI
ncbi:hypothetical protein HMPREF0673_02070 [Leyella stercorea DSM 18206]|uniref:Uncharacterized protein n=1 Tax=Leyella stercorea DSM 18206 TaxID=1002367 RepID=G6AZK6_9BACT|nr:hypothetical protein HMPREF0673_02070 [Leyella stercorea DSM 18206]